ncbi:MAG: hypothetical protein ACMUIL_00930 [bacterium]
MEETAEEMSCDGEPSGKIFPGMPHIENLEISIKPKVSDTIQDECLRPPIDFKYELAPNWELFLRLNTFINNPTRGEDRNGMSDISIGTKYHLKKLFRPYVNTITAFSVQIPTINNDEDTPEEYHTYHYRPQIIFTKTFPEWYNMLLLTDINLDILSGSPDNIEMLVETSAYNSLSMLVGLSLPTRFCRYSLDTEWVTTGIDGGSQNSVYVRTGVYWVLTQKSHPWIRGDLDLGAGVRCGIHDTDDDFAFFVKVNWDIPFKMRFKKRASPRKSIHDL